MKTYLECVPCFFQQALWIAQKLKLDQPEREEIIRQVSKLFSDRISFSQPPPYIAKHVYGIIREISKTEDPFKEEKELSTQMALRFYGHLKEKIQKAGDPLLEAIRIAILGNIIDFGALRNFDLDEEVKRVEEKSFAVFDYEEFKERLSKVKWILYLGDNAGECVFDKLLIEVLGKKVYYAVRSRPIINDATYKEAKEAGIDEVAQIIDSGSELPGIYLEEVNPDFLSLFEKAQLIISKGQGNYETLSEVKRPIFFMLQIKCPVVAKSFKANVGDFVLSFALKSL